jgi:hypothetical protein
MIGIPSCAPPGAPTWTMSWPGLHPRAKSSGCWPSSGSSYSCLLPAAKGRIERLWWTFQDRLTKELRQAVVATQEAANGFLPSFLARYNARFTHPAADPTPAWVPLPADWDLAYYFAAREHRRVRADQTIA